MSDRLLRLVVDSRSTADRAPTGAAFRELDRVRTLAEVIGERVPTGHTGTIVAVWGAGAACDVAFTRPVEALAVIAPEILVLVERAGA